VIHSEIHPLKLSISIALLSVSLIAYQLLLIQILSIVQWYHFAYMIISVALLGFGAAGTFLSLFQKWLLEKLDALLPGLVLIASVIMAVSISLSQTDLFYFDSYRLFNDLKFLWKLFATYLIFLLPFFFGALAIGLTFTKKVEKIGVFYFANMVGSGIGGIAVVVLMWVFFPEKLAVLLSALVFLSGLILIIKKYRTAYTIVITFVIALLTYFYLNPPSLKISEYKGLSKTLDLPGTEIIETESSPYGLIHLVSSSYLRYAPGLSLTYPDQVLVNNAAFNNGEWSGPLLQTAKDSLYYFPFSTEYLPYVIDNRSSALILNSGTGRYVQYAVLEGAESIRAVEPDKTLIQLLIKKYPELIDSVYNSSAVDLKNVYPRTYLLSAELKFDLIQIPIIDAFGGTSGMYALQEQYLLTKESFKDMYSKLKNDGVICISTWIDYPYKNPLKIVATLAEMLDETGIKDLTSHITAIKNWNTLTVLVKKNKLIKAELENISAFCKEMKFDPVIFPGISEERKDFYNKLQDKSFYSYLNLILGSQQEREKLYSEYPFNIRPAADNRPYYSQFLKWESVEQLSESYSSLTLAFFEIGYVLLYLTFFQILLLAFILIILPLLKIRWKGKNKLWILLYFSGIGLGYIFIEIILIQRFTLYFGNIIYSAAAVVSLMLIASGFGSLVSQRLKPESRRIIVIISIIVVSVIIYLLILSLLIKATIVYSLPIKIIFASILIVPPAFFMGMPFPLGLRFLALKNDSSAGNQIPWAWGINGIFSVTGAVSATIVAVEFGFIWVMIFAAGAYLLALLSNLVRN
jgi:hypothetical protein